MTVCSKKACYAVTPLFLLSTFSLGLLSSPCPLIMWYNIYPSCYLLCEHWMSAYVACQKISSCETLTHRQWHLLQMCLWRRPFRACLDYDLAVGHRSVEVGLTRSWPAVSILKIAGKHDQKLCLQKSSCTAFEEWLKSYLLTILRTETTQVSFCVPKIRELMRAVGI